MPEPTRDPNVDTRLPHLYESAGNLEETLAPLVNNADATLDAGQVGAFNQILADARALLPNSKALREDVAEIDAGTRLADAHHALRTTLVPTLHNALRPDAYQKTG